MIPAASRSNCFSIPFCNPFPTPSKITRIKIPEATEIPVRKVLSLFFEIASKISFQRSRLNISRRPYLFYHYIVYDQTVLEHDIALAHGSDIAFVRHDQYGFAFVVDALYEFH